jgi:small-conductance mechanosensitive channel
VRRALALAALLTLPAAIARAEPEDAASSYGPPLPPPSASAPESASVAPVAQPLPSASAVTAASAAIATSSASAGAGAGTPGDVKLQDSVVFQLLLPHGNQTLRQRADAASAAMKEALKSAAPEEVRVEQRGDAAIVYAGQTPIVQLYREDARAAGDATLGDHAAAVAARVREALRHEQKRSAIAGTVFSLSLVVLLGLIVLYLLRKVAEFMERMKNWVSANPERIPAVRLYSMEVVRPAALRSGLVVGLGAGRWLGQLALIYFWLLATLSLFESTRGYTERLTGFVITPLSALTGRVASSLPILVVAAIAGIAVYILLRFVGLFFNSVARGETKVVWLPLELAEPTSLLLRAGIVAATLVFAAPVVTGDPEGALARTGVVLLFALGLSSTPLLATVLAGTAVVYSRRLRTGLWAEIDGRVGRIRSVGLLEVRLLDLEGAEIRIPHLLCLVRTTRVLGSAPRASVELTVAAKGKIEEVRALLEQAAAELGERAHAEIVSADGDGISYRLSVSSDASDTVTRLHTRALEALERHGVSLGRRRPGAA